MFNFIFLTRMISYASFIIVVIFPQFRVAMAIFALFSGVFWGVVTEFVATLVASDVTGNVTDLVDGDVAV